MEQSQKQQLFIESLKYQDLEHKIAIWNEFCQESENGSMDDYIYQDIEELAELCNFEGLDLARMVFFGSLHNWYDYVRLNGYGNVESVRDDSVIYFDYLAEWLEESNHQEWIDFCDSLDDEDDDEE